MESQLRQASGLSRASGRVGAASLGTDRGNSPAAYESARYRRLAAVAARAGYPEISAARIHDWTVKGLLIAHEGEDPDGRLLALCRLRRIVTSHAALLTLLWVDGWHVDAARLKLALGSTLPPHQLSRADDKALDELDRMGASKASRLVRLLRPGRIGAVAPDAAAALANCVFTADGHMDRGAADAIERLLGLDRARRDALPGAEPWLSGSSSSVFNLIRRYASAAQIRRYLRPLAPERLQASREHARYLIYDLPDMARAMEALNGRGFGGWRWMALAGPRQAPILALIAVVVDRYPSLRRRLDELCASLEPLRGKTAALAALASAYEQQHPDQKRALRRNGLLGLEERQELRTIEGVEAIVAEFGPG